MGSINESIYSICHLAPVKDKQDGELVWTECTKCDKLCGAFYGKLEDAKAWQKLIKKTDGEPQSGGGNE